MTPPLKPSQDISPFYKTVGSLAALLSCGAVGLILWRGQAVTLPVIGLAALPFVLGMLLMRPALVDAGIRRAMARLPFTKYGDPDADK